MRPYAIIFTPIDMDRYGYNMVILFFFFFSFSSGPGVSTRRQTAISRWCSRTLPDERRRSFRRSYVKNAAGECFRRDGFLVRRPDNNDIIIVITARLYYYFPVVVGVACRRRPGECRGSPGTRRRLSVRGLRPV